MAWPKMCELCGKEGEPMTHCHGMKSLHKDKQNFILKMHKIHCCAKDAETFQVSLRRQSFGMVRQQQGCLGATGPR